MSAWHLAQYNVARAIAPAESEQMADFYAQVAAVNAAAEASPGFVWRPVGEDGASQQSVAQSPGDAFLLVNLSVWESVDALKEFTYRSVHAGVFRERLRWFEKPNGPHQVLWWVPAGHRPSFAEGERRLALLRANGPSVEAFTFGQVVEQPRGGN